MRTLKGFVLDRISRCFAIRCAVAQRASLWWVLHCGWARGFMGCSVLNSTWSLVELFLFGSLSLSGRRPEPRWEIISQTRVVGSDRFPGGVIDSCLFTARLIVSGHPTLPKVYA